MLAVRRLTLVSSFAAILLGSVLHADNSKEDDLARQQERQRESSDST